MVRATVPHGRRWGKQNRREPRPAAAQQRPVDALLGPSAENLAADAHAVTVLNGDQPRCAWTTARKEKAHSASPTDGDGHVRYGEGHWKGMVLR